MFFVKPTKKSIIKEKTELKYKFFFWNKFYGLLEEQITHKLDYIPESWVVTQFSSLHPGLVYDTQGLVEFLYTDVYKMNMQLKNMRMDYIPLPTQDRNLNLINREYCRIQLLKQHSSFRLKKDCRGGVFTLKIPGHTVFMATNLVFIQRKQIKKYKKCQQL